jgi:Flp pilus assembly protein TadG
MIKTHSPLRRKRAQALAEMAVMVPFLVIGMMGMLDLGRAFYYQISITNAVREGARYAASPYYMGLNPTCATIPPAPNPGTNCVTPGDGAIQTRVQNELAGSQINVPASDIQVFPDQSTRSSNYTNGTSSQYPIRVSASFKFNFITPIIGALIGNPLTINTSATFRAEY